MAQNNNSFVKVFLPGLVIGLIVGSLAGAILPDLLAGPAVKPQAGNADTANRDRAFDDREQAERDIPAPPIDEQLEETGTPDEDDDSSGG